MSPLHSMEVASPNIRRLTAKDDDTKNKSYFRLFSPYHKSEKGSCRIRTADYYLKCIFTTFRVVSASKIFMSSAREGSRNSFHLWLAMNGTTDCKENSWVTPSKKLIKVRASQIELHCIRILWIYDFIVLRRFGSALWWFFGVLTRVKRDPVTKPAVHPSVYLPVCRTVFWHRGLSISIRRVTFIE